MHLGARAGGGENGIVKAVESVMQQREPEGRTSRRLVTTKEWGE